MNLARSKELQSRFHSVIPGGAHTYAKGDDQYPEGMPVYISHGKGAHVWDLDGNEFIEYGMGLRTVTLGHACKPVADAARRALDLGSNFVRPTLLELECAEALRDFIPGAEMVKFGKHGSDATSAAVKLARAHTGRKRIAICEQPFFSVDDWFIGSTPMNAGIPEEVRRLTVKFQYNDLDSLARLFAEHPGQIAAVMLEAERDVEPAPGFLSGVRDLCTREGAVLIFDEMITGFRWHNAGAQGFYGITPDLSAFGKAIANGFSVSALVGRRDIMERGGLQHAGERVFLLSTTHGAESHSLAAAMETIRTYRTQPVVATLWERGAQLRDGLLAVVKELGLEEHFRIHGRPCCLTYATLDADRRPSQPFRTLFLQETIRRGLLMPSLVVSCAHSPEDIRRTIDAVADALKVYRDALRNGIDRYLEGRSVKPVFRQFN